MAVGGNLRARTFFKQHGWDELGSDKIEAKYSSRAAQLYRKQLEKDAARLAAGDAAAPSPPSAGSTMFAGFDMAPKQEAPKPFAGAAASAPATAAPAVPAVNAAAAPKPSSSTSPAVGAAPAAAARPAAKSRLLASRKPGVAGGKPGGGGLGVKKMAVKVDDSLFEQAPEEDAVPAPAAPPAGSGAPVEDELLAVTGEQQRL